MEHLIDWTIRQNIELAILVCLILVVRFVFKKTLAPKAIHLLWLIVLIKSVTYLNVPYISKKQTEANSELNSISSRSLNNPKNTIKNEMKPSDSDPNESLIFENITQNVVLTKNDQVVKTEATPSLFDSLQSYFTVEKIKTIFLWTYLLTLSALLVHLVISLIKVRNLKVGRIQNDLLTKKLQALKTKLKINSKVEIYESNIIPSPTLIGVHSFVILIPANILGNISNANLEDIVTHELMHIKRKDTLVNLIFRIVACLYFYNPFIWLAYFTMKKDMESACDQDVLIKSDFKNNISYAESLLLITKLCKQNGQVNHHAMMFIHKNTFRRIEMITNLKKPGVLSKIAFLSLMVISLVVFVPSYQAISEDGKKEKDFDKVLISIDENKNGQAAEVFLKQQLKNTLDVKNVFFNYQTGGFSPAPFGFKGSFKQFKEMAFKESGERIYYYHENLYSTNHEEKVFLSEFAKIKRFKDTNQSCIDLLNKKIPSITIKNSDMRNVLSCIAKEVGFEIDLITMCDYEKLKTCRSVMLEKKILDENNLGKLVYEFTFTDITAWDLLMSLSLNNNFLFTFEVKENKVYLSQETSFNKEVRANLQQIISLDKKDYKFNDFVLALKQKLPKLTIFVVEKLYDSSRANDDALIKLATNQGTFEAILKDALGKIKMDYSIENGQLTILSKKFLEEIQQEEELCKQVYLSANTKWEKNTVDINKLLNEVVTFKYDGITLSEGLKQLGDLVGVKFVFEVGFIKENGLDLLSLGVKDISLKNALKLLLTPYNLKFEHYENNVLLIQNKQKNIKKRSIFEVPSTISELNKFLPTINNLKLSKDEKYYVVKTSNEINLYFNNIDKIIINNKIIEPTDILAVTNNLILVKVKKSEFENGTECKVLFVNNSYIDSGIEMKE